MCRLTSVPGGLSPRVRGNLRPFGPPFKPRASGLSPRVRGNPRDRLPASALTWRGLSPRVRGNLWIPWELDGRLGWVYPRVCGGTPAPAPPISTIRGLSPRVRGTALHHRPGRAARGLSPRVRGNLPMSRMVDQDFQVGSIPACAGEPVRPLAVELTPATRSIPACAGEPTRRRLTMYIIPHGLSPRVRGNQQNFFKPISAADIGSIPACAGEPCSQSLKCITVILGLSPRVRGNPGVR